MRTPPCLVLFAAIMIAYSPSLQAADNYFQWTYYRDITVNTKSTGAGIDTAQTRFPLLVRLSAADSLVFKSAKAGGADIRFSKVSSVATHFPYQIESWDADARKAAIWVLIDTVRKDSVQPAARMYWGRSDASDSSRGLAVFDTSVSRGGGFQAVWHMNEAAGDTLRDATVNGFRGEPNGAGSAGVPANKAGVIGSCKDFLNRGLDTGSYFRILNTDQTACKLNFDTAAAYSLSAWVKVDTFGAGGYFISKNFYNLYAAPNGYLSFSEVRGTQISPNLKYVQNGDSITGQWRYVVGVHKTGANAPMTVYVDGKAASGSVLQSAATNRILAWQLRLGVKTDNSKTAWLNGAMDEVRLENVARGGDWIKLCYRTQKSDSCVVLGAYACMPPAFLAYPKDSLTAKLDSALAAVTPSYTGKIDSFTVRGLSTDSFPSGLSFDKMSGTIAGTPTRAGSGKYVITAINEAGYARDTIAISVYAPASPPAISSQPGNVWARVKSSGVKFGIIATGTAPLTFEWKRNGVSVAGANKDTLPLGAVRREDDGAVYTCSVVNGAGSKASSPCTLHVVAALFGVTPSSGVDTLTATFSDSSTGGSAAHPLDRKWSFGDGDSSVEVRPVHHYSKPGNFPAKLVVSARGVADTASISVTVQNSLLNAGFVADTLCATGPLLVTFTDTSKGTIFRRTWYFGDGKTASDSLRGPVKHSFDSVGAYSVQLMVEGAAGRDSAMKEKYVVIRPSNPIRLKATPLSSRAMVLQWGRVTGADSVQIAYSAKTPPPVGMNVPDQDFFFAGAAGQAGADTLRDLEPKTRYFFGARIFQRGVSSFITDSSSDSCTTPAVYDSTSPPPEVTVTKITFDSATNTITVRWRIDPEPRDRDSMDVGVFCSTLGYRSEGFTTPDTVKPNTKAIDSIIVRLGEELLFDATYFFTLALRERGKAWFPPSDSAEGSVKTPGFVSQAVQYGVDHPVAYADNKRVRISVDKDNFPTNMDKNGIARWKRPDSIPGFVAVSEGFEFLVKYQSSPLRIGTKYSLLPPGLRRGQIRMYRFKNNAWYLDRSGEWHDTAEGYVGITTGDINAPFIAMIDTAKPLVAVHGRPDSAVVNGQPITDQFAVRDNVANTSWSFSYAKGGFPFEPENSDSGLDSACEYKITTEIPQGFVSADQGVRAVLRVTDGVNAAIVDVSRRVIREAGTETVVTDELKWVPIFVNVQLDSPEVRKTLATLGNGAEWTYDNKEFRLFRWFSYGDNLSNKSDKYVEYSAGLDSVFQLVPGRLLWIKTRTTRNLDFGRGVTLDLGKAYEVTLQRDTWTDFALPFKFDVTVGDVLDATKAAGEMNDNWQIYKWSKDSTNRYHVKEMYFPALGIEAFDDKTALFSSEKAGGGGFAYSIYNPLETDIRLRFPPIPASMSKQVAGKAKKTKDGRGAIVISARTAAGQACNAVYCGLTDGKPAKRYFPAAPSLMGGVRLRVCDEGMRAFGHVVASETWDKGAGTSMDLSVQNGAAKADDIEIVLSGDGALPPALRFMVFDPSKNSFAEAGDDGVVRLTAEMGPGETGYYQLIAGSGDYLAKVRKTALSMKTALVGLHPNPFRQAVRISFSLPFGFFGRVHFAIYDACGRQVWNSSVRGRGGANDVVWTGRAKSGRAAAAGLYILRMTAENAKGERLGVFERKLTYMP